ncbi:MAG: RluA family pseudouridine synthase [Candidatus Dormibacteria bacterium]
MSALPRLDLWLAEERGITRHAAQTLIDAGLVTMNGRLAKASHRVRVDDVIAVAEAPAVAARPSPAVHAPAITLVFEDEWLAVVDKPAGLVVHPAPGHPADTLVDALKARGTTWSLLGGEERAGIVHRLDRDTSGLLVVAKTEAAHRSLSEQLRDRTLGRTYVAVVHGGFREHTGTIDAPIGRDRRDRKRMAVVDDGRPAVTDFTVSEGFGDISALEVHLRTGRTHQIRVHMAYIRHPLAGDPVYGRGGAPGRPALHARRLTFRHPADGEPRTFESPLPEDLRALLHDLRERQQ